MKRRVGPTKTRAKYRESESRQQLSTRQTRHPTTTLQRKLGNQELQQLATQRQHRSETQNRSPTPTDDHEGPPDGSVGERLSGDRRRTMERALGTDFGDVRVHDGVGAVNATRSLNADAYTAEKDVVMRRADSAFDNGAESLLLAHELAHVAQFQQLHDDRMERPVTRRRDAAEREATRAALRVVAGETVHVTETPRAPVATGIGDWLEDRARDVGSVASSAASGVGSAAKSVGSTIASGASSAVEGAKSVGSSIASGAQSAWTSTRDAYLGTVDAAADMMLEHGGPLGAIHAGMRQNAEWIQQGGRWLEGQIDAGQDWLAGKVQAGADMAEGIPVLEQLADAGAWGFDKYTQLQAGILQGATTFGSGLLGMAANPVDAATGLYSMVKHVPAPGITSPARSIDAIGDLISGEAGIGDVANRMINPLATIDEDIEFWKQMGSGIAQDYQRSIGEDEDYVQAIGRAGFDIGSFFFGGGGAAVKAGGTGARAANVASRASRGSRAARTAGAAGDAARASSRANVGAPRLGSGRSPNLIEGRITSTADEIMTTQKAMTQSGPVSAGNQWVMHKGQWVRRSGNRWRNPQGQFAEGPYSLTGGRSGGPVTKSLDDIIERAQSTYEMGASRAEDFMSVTGRTRSGMPRTSGDWRSRYGPGQMQDHHLLPQEFLNVPQVRDQLSQIIKSRRSTPEDFIHQNLARITQQHHLRLDKAGYAADWARWFKENPQFTKAQLEAQIKAMMDAYEIPRSARNWRKQYGRN